MSARHDLIARTHECARPLLYVQEQIRQRLIAEEWADAIATVHNREFERRCICRNGTFVEPLHHHAVQRRGSQFANRREVSREL